MTNSDPDGPVPVLGAVTLNGGDAAIALGCVRFLERVVGPSRSIVVLDRSPDVAASLHHDLQIYPWLSEAARRPTGSGRAGRAFRRLEQHRRNLAIEHHLLRRSDERKIAALIDRAPTTAAIGGTYLVDHYPWEVRLPELEIAARSGAPLYFLTQSMGPFTKAGTREMRLARVLESAQLIMARDERTNDAVLRLAPDARVVVAPDMAFELGREATHPSRPGRSDSAAHREARALSVAISVREWPLLRSSGGMARYTRELSAAVTCLVRQHGSSVTFISTCQGVPAYRYDDSKVADAIVASLPDDVAKVVAVDRSFRGPHALIERLGQFDLLVATRMHAAILGWIAGTPSVAIAYESKTLDLFEHHQIGRLAQPMETFDADWVLAAIGTIASGTVEDVASIRQRVAREVAELDRIASDLRVGG